MSTSLKSLVKSLLPAPCARWIASERRRARYRGLSTKEAFEKVYQEGFWGRDNEGDPISGSGSHEREIVDPYVQALRAFLVELGRPSIADLGCGDFNIGRQLRDFASLYLACDISETILAINRRKYDLNGVEFRQLDLAQDALPPADVGLVRQVLQHLSNAEIVHFVVQLNARKPYRYLVVTEHVAERASAGPNFDKPSGPGVRVENHSGIDLKEPPFNLDCLHSRVLHEVRQDCGGIRASIVTTAYCLRDP